MEPYIVVPIPLMDQAAHNMLSRMVLHTVEPHLPVQDAMYHFPHRQRFFADQENILSFFYRIKHRDICMPWPRQFPAVAALPAAFRIKGTAVQPDQVPALVLSHARHAGVEFFRIGVLIIKLLRHAHPFLLNQFP